MTDDLGYDCVLCRNADKKAAIAYTYEDSTPAKADNDDEEQNSDDDSSDTDVETADLGNSGLSAAFVVLVVFC